MSKIKSFLDLEVWKKSHEFVLKIYEKTKFFPSDERFGMTSQVRRASVSIPNNICEGTGRRTTKELLYFLNISRGSLEETKYLILLSKDLQFLDDTTYNEFRNNLDEIGRMLNGLINSLRSNLVNEPGFSYGDSEFFTNPNH